MRGSKAIALGAALLGFVVYSIAASNHGRKLADAAQLAHVAGVSDSEAGAMVARGATILAVGALLFWVFIFSLARWRSADPCVQERCPPFRASLLFLTTFLVGMSAAQLVGPAPLLKHIALIAATAVAIVSLWFGKRDLPLLHALGIRRSGLLRDALFGVLALLSVKGITLGAVLLTVGVYLHRSLSGISGHWVVLIVVVPVLEEVAYRGILHRGLLDTSRGTRILLTSLFFTFSHPFHPVGSVTVMIAAVHLALLREYRGTITGCLVTHSLANALALIM